MGGKGESRNKDDLWKPFSLSVKHFLGCLMITFSSVDFMMWLTL